MSGFLKTGKGKSLQVVGLNSGTSGDGLDVTLVRFSSRGLPEILMSAKYPYPSKLQEKIIRAGEVRFADGIGWLKLDAELGILMGELTRKFLSKAKRARLRADLIGSHGQTVRHIPSEFSSPLTLQVGDPSKIARITELPVVSDFRRSDTAAGGQGAPMSPILHEMLFRARGKWRAIVNIGGIANATILPPLESRRKPVASDCGPGNMAIDIATIILFGKPYDEHGLIAQHGKPDSGIVSRSLRMPYFKLPPPKSTGRELFGQLFIEGILKDMRNAPYQDIIATLTEITAAGIADFINRFGRNVKDIFLCGGGAKNYYIVSRLREIFPGGIVTSTEDLGYDPDYLEALLWAYLAYCFVCRRPIDTSYFTGARRPYVPGRLCLP